MTTTEEYVLGSQTTILSTELNSLANNGTALTNSAFDNTQGQICNGYTLCDLELYATYGTAPTANTGVSLWFLQTQDGTNYEDGSNSVTPARLPDCVFPLRAGTTAQRIIRRVFLAWDKFTPLVQNNGTGQAMASSGNTVKIRPVTRQAV
jgi:hypothetical protein